MYQRKEIKGFLGYEIDSDGNVFEDGILKKTHKSAGYIGVSIKGISYLVHRLVLQTFIGDCPVGMEACHGDGDKQNPTLKNLRWDTHRNNMVLDGKRLGTYKFNEKFGIISRCKNGEKNINNILTEKQVRVIKHALSFKVRGVRKWLSKMCGCKMQTIDDIRTGRCWSNVVVS